MKDDLKTILKEMRLYNPKADMYCGQFIIPGWADRIEKALTIELPKAISIEGGAYCTAHAHRDKNGEYLYRDEVIEVLNTAGVTVKSD